MNVLVDCGGGCLLLSIILSVILLLLGILAVGAGVFTWYVYAFYSGHIDRIFETKPLLLADQGSPVPDATTVEFKTADGRRLVGSFLPHRSPMQRGAVLFLPEFGANRWMAVPYVGYLRDEGFDILTIDFNSSGESDLIPNYESLQWPTLHELADAKAALGYLKGRSDLNGVPIVVFGVSKGGGVAITLAAEDQAIQAIVTDGAFPVHSMVVHYSMTWIEIFSTSRWIYRYLPRWFYGIIVSMALRRIERSKRVRYLSLEKAMTRIDKRPLLMIHGKNDNYIKANLIEELIATAGEPKELWIVPKAKHNRCLEREGEGYRRRVSGFLRAAFPLPGDVAQPLPPPQRDAS